MNPAEAGATGAGWLSCARTAAIQPIAAQLHLTVHGSTIACPACKAPQRGRHDKRLPAGFNGHRWRCYVCGEWGDGSNLVALALTGERRDTHPAVMLWFADHQDLPAAAPAETEAEGRYPDYMEVYRLLRTAAPATHDQDAMLWLYNRLGDLAAHAAPLVRVIAPNMPVPTWARSWWGRGYRAIVPVYDEEGTPRSVRARRYAMGGTSEMPKALPPEGYAVRGLVMANEAGRVMLCGYGKPTSVIVAEGEPDWLLWSGQDAAHETGCAVLGVVAGSWTPDIAACIPANVRVHVVTHHDEKGDAYAQVIRRSLPNHEVVRG